MRRFSDHQYIIRFLPDLNFLDYLYGFLGIVKK